RRQVFQPFPILAALRRIARFCTKNLSDRRNNREKFSGARFFSAHWRSRLSSFRCAGNTKTGPTEPDYTQTGHIEIRLLDIVLFRHPRFEKQTIQLRRHKQHETKTNIYQHSGSSVRVPIDGDVRSASSALGLYRSDHDL